MYDGLKYTTHARLAYRAINQPREQPPPRHPPVRGQLVSSSLNNTLHPVRPLIPSSLCTYQYGIRQTISWYFRRRRLCGQTRCRSASHQGLLPTHFLGLSGCLCAYQCHLCLLHPSIRSEPVQRLAISACMFAPSAFEPD